MIRTMEGVIYRQQKRMKDGSKKKEKMKFIPERNYTCFKAFA